MTPEEMAVAACLAWGLVCVAGLAVARAAVEGGWAWEVCKVAGFALLTLGAAVAVIAVPMWLILLCFGVAP